MEDFSANNELIREKKADAYRTIGEVADILNVPQHVLRFWESKIVQIKPKKNRGRRYYSPQDIDILRKIKYLLYEQGLTIKGVIQHLEQKNNDNIYPDRQLHLLESKESNANNRSTELQTVINKLKKSRDILKEL